MTPDQKFARYVKVSIGAFVVLFAYYIVADIWLPITPQSRIYHPVVQVAPQVSGRVTQVLVTNNQPVKAGDVLFTIDRTPYELALEQALLARHDAERQNQQYDANIAALKANIVAAKAKLSEQSTLKKRGESLFAQKAIGQQELDSIHTNYAVSEANLSSLHAQLEQAIVARGETDENNLAIRHADNQLAQARLNLSYTTVLAQNDGIVSNLQLLNGAYAQVGQPLLAIVANNADLVADFREKSLVNVKPNSRAKVAFDSLPGEVFDATVSSFEAGVSDGQLLPNGNLSTTESSNRWVRDAQRQRIHLSLPNNADTLASLPSGARATVQLLPESGIGQWLGSTQIRFISLLHYIY